MSTGTAFVVAVLLLAANAFFVGAEFAVMAARRSQIEPMALEGSRRARTTLWAMEHISAMLATAQLGITVCSLGLGAVAKPALSHLVEDAFKALNVPEALVYPVSFALALGIVVYLHVVLGEMVPKNLAIAGPDRTALVLAPPLVWVARLLSPVIWVLNGIANLTLRALGIEPKDEVTSTFTAEEVHSIVAESRREGLLGDEHGLVVGALEFSDRDASDVAVPLNTLACVSDGATPADVERLVARTGFSRFPVLADGDLSGYLHLKDVLYADDERHDEPVPLKRIRSLVTVQATDDVEDVLAAMQRSGAHLARVVDENGRVSGVVFLEDVLEELVGEVRDETRREVGRRA